MTNTEQPSLFGEDDDLFTAIRQEQTATTNGTSHALNGGQHADNGQRRGRGKKEQEPLSSRQQISSIIKSVRDLLRKDAGLAGDTDRLPQLTWLLFLKCIDDFDQAQSDIYGPDDYIPLVEAPFRWRDWVVSDSQRNRLTGNDLLKFVNEELFPYLSNRGSSEGGNLRNVIATIFQGTYNRIRSGFILRDVVNKLNEVNFNSSDDIHAISHFYETMLREMRDASGDSGEFYTPRPIVRFMIDRLDPKLHERILDPSCGTAGFLVEAYNHLKPQIQHTADLASLYDNLVGYEKKSMPYLLAIMNMLIHDIEQPHIEERNTLAINVRQIREAARVDVIATNPPFGSEEEDGIVKNFPESMQAKETSLLFFQYIMAMLKRPAGRCGVVLPNGFLFGGGVGATIKKQLLTRFNLHTIVRLPVGAFAPYTSIPTNILFFEACARHEDALDEAPCTREVWYYEIPLPEGRNSYTKTKPMQFEEFADCISWWDNRAENEHAWKVPVEEILANDCNLDRKNPSAQKDIEHRAPAELVESILAKEQRITEIMQEIKGMLEEGEKGE